ncbi:MAG TPA: uracil-DNA glycosylase [Acidiferrobacter sp.]|nr:uracil-DNA glycosylase [Acidiferrobacter sp.]
MLEGDALSQCRKCPRLASFRDEAKVRYPDYRCLPVPALGADNAKIVIVGLAPGLHGANATGRAFTGDFAGILLYETLYRMGLSNQPRSVAVGDGLALKGCRISNAVKCVPPANRPTGAEIQTCAPYLTAELAHQPAGGVIIALGRIAHDAVLRAFREPLSHFRFGHGARHVVGGRVLWDSYHCSRYNTQTKRLTEASFTAVFEAALREVL